MAKKGKTHEVEVQQFRISVCMVTLRMISSNLIAPTETISDSEKKTPHIVLFLSLLQEFFLAIRIFSLAVEKNILPREKFLRQEKIVLLLEHIKKYFLDILSYETENISVSVHFYQSALVIVCKGQKF